MELEALHEPSTLQELEVKIRQRLVVLERKQKRRRLNERITYYIRAKYLR